MKKNYIKPAICCILVKVDRLMSYSSIEASEYRTTNESFSRQMDDDFDDWEE